MRVQSWKKLLGRLIVVVLLFFILYVLVDLLYLSLLPLRSREGLLQPFRREPVRQPMPQQDPGYWQDQLEQGPQPLTRTVTISVTATGVSVDMNLWLTSTHPLVENSIGGPDEGSVSPFALALFGEVLLEGDPLSEEEYSIPIWQMDRKSGLVNIHIQALRENDEAVWGRIDRGGAPASVAPEHDELILWHSDMHLLNFYPLPDEATQDSIRMSRDASKGIRYASFRLEPTETVQRSDSVSSSAARESRQRFLQRLGDLIELPMMSQILYGVVISLPLLIFWLQVTERSNNESAFVISLTRVIGSLLLFHFTLAFLSGSGNLMNDSRLIQHLSHFVDQTITPYFWPRVRPLIRSGPYRLGTVIVGVLLPGLLLQRSRESSSKGHRSIARWIRGFAALLPFAGLVAPVVYLLVSSLRKSGMPSIPMWTVVSFTASAITLGIWWALNRLYRFVVLQAPRAGLTLLATWLIVAMGALNGCTFGTEGRGSWLPLIWLILTIVLGVSLLVSLASVIGSFVKRAFPTFTLPRSVTVTLFILAIIFSIPLGKVVRSTRQLAYYNSVITLAYRLDESIIFVWIAGVLYLLYQGGRKEPRISSFTRMIGVLGASSLMFNTHARWLYIPVTFLIGWLCLDRWLVRSSNYWQKLSSLFECVFRERLDLLDQILDLNAAADAYKEFRKKLKEKLSSGELEFTDYDEKLEQYRKRLTKLREDAKIEGHPVKKVALTFGPYQTAWENGVHGGKFALLFASPWIVLSLRNFLSSSMPQQTYPLWGFAADLLTIFARWTTYGFVFGYFYPYIRGRNGLQKGFALFLCSVLPSLPIMAVYNATGDAWQASLFWVLQVFIQCMLLGLVAFDYHTLRQGHYEWQMLFEVHGLTSVGVSVSSIIVAIGAAVTTLLTSQATSLVTMALKFVIPQAPPDLPVP